MGESLHVCVYEKCGRSFDNPVRLTDLSHKPRMETYYACPYCFSKVNDDNADETDQEIDHIHGTGYEIPQTAGKKNHKPAIQKEPEKALSCPHHIGYLKTRAKDASVPDTCLTCPKILQCMV